MFNDADDMFDLDDLDPDVHLDLAPPERLCSSGEDTDDDQPLSVLFAASQAADAQATILAAKHEAGSDVASALMSAHASMRATTNARTCAAFAPDVVVTTLPSPLPHADDECIQDDDGDASDYNEDGSCSEPQVHKHRCVRKQTQFYTTWTPLLMSQEERKEHKRLLEAGSKLVSGKGAKKMFLCTWKPTWEITSQIPMHAIVAYAGDITAVLEHAVESSLGDVYLVTWSKLSANVWMDEYTVEQWYSPCSLPRAFVHVMCVIQLQSSHRDVCVQVPEAAAGNRARGAATAVRSPGLQHPGRGPCLWR